jgi:hypothetical protein
MAALKSSSFWAAVFAECQIQEYSNVETISVVGFVEIDPECHPG